MTCKYKCHYSLIVTFTILAAYHWYILNINGYILNSNSFIGNGMRLGHNIFGTEIRNKKVIMTASLYHSPYGICFFPAFFFFFSFFFFKHLYWSKIALQWYVSFCFITKWISYTYTYVPISAFFLLTKMCYSEYFVLYFCINSAPTILDFCLRLFWNLFSL